MKKSKYDAQTKKVLSRIAANIRELRKQRGLTQEGLEEHGVNVRWFQKLERGDKTPTIPTLQKLSKIFRVKLQDFFQGT